MKKVETEIVIQADAADVWRAVSEGEELKRWFPPDARVTPPRSDGTGGVVWLSWGEGMEWEAPIELWEPGRRLRTTDPAPSTLAVDYILEGRGGETLLRIVHSGFADDAWDDELETLKAGWRTFAANLKLYLERHRGEPRTLAYFRHPVVELPRAEVFPRVLRAFGIELAGEGERFRSPLFEGVAQVIAPPINFTGVVENLGDGLLMIEIEPGQGRCRPAVWLSLYGGEGARASGLQARMTDMLTRAFA